MKKFYYLLLPLAAMFALNSCGDDDEPDNTKLTKTSYTLYHEGTEALEGSNLNSLAWDSENEFVATAKDGIVTGQYVGQTNVKAAGKNLSFTVEVKPLYHTYTEPSLDWGMSLSAIKAKHGAPYSESSKSLIYETGNTNAPLVLYSFEDNQLSSIGVVCKLSVGSQLVDFLTERYVVVDVNESKYTATLLHCYGKISDPKTDYGVVMGYSSSISGILVVYAPLTDSSSRAGYGAEFDKAFNAVESALN